MHPLPNISLRLIFDKHDLFVSKCREGNPDVLFIGDSITALMTQTDIWEKWFLPMNSWNFGIGGDQTQHLLWRIENGELEKIRPKAIVVLIGTNNHEHSAEEVAKGIEEIVKSVSRQQPQTLLPRGQYPNKLREKNAKINILMVGIVKSFSKCQLVDITANFIGNDGTISHHDMHDYLHLTRQGYAKAFQSVYTLLQQLLNE